MDINVNISVNSQTLVEANKQLKETNKSAVDLNNTLKDKTGEAQITRNTNEIGKTGRAMTGLKKAVTGFDKLVGAEIGQSAEKVGALGQTFVGLGKALPLVSTGLRAIGLALKSNPLFAIGAVIAGVVVAIGSLLNAFGFLQPIIDGIGALIGGLVEGFKSLTNAIGLTSASMVDGKKDADEYKKAIDGINSAKDATIARARTEIELAEAQGKTIEEITLLRYKETKAESEASIDRQNNFVKQQEILRNELDRTSTSAQRYSEIQLELASLDEKIAAEADIRETQNTRVKIIQIEARKAIDEREKKRQEDAADKRRKTAEDAVRVVMEQQKLEVLKTKENSEEKIKAQINEFNAVYEAKKKYAKDLGITELQLKILDQERMNSVEALVEQYNKLNKTTEKTGLSKIAESAGKLGAGARSISEDYRQTLKTNIESQQLIVGGLKQILDFENLSYDERIIKINQFYNEQKRLIEQQEKLAVSLAQKEGQNVDLVKQEYRTKELQAEKEKNDAILKINEDREKRIREINKLTFDEGVETANQVISAFGAFSEFMFENRKKMLQEGSKEEEAAAKEQFEVRKRMAIASAIISGISGVVNILAAPTTLPDPIGAIYKGVQIAALAISTAAQIGKISSQTFESSSASVGGGGATTQSGASATPSMNLFGQGNQMNVSSAQPTTTVSDPNGNVLRVIAEVSETEITAVQMRNRRYYNSSEL